MKREYIVFIDSGVGGLTTLSETIKLIKANYIYFADNNNSPYGSHSKDEIYCYLKKIIEILQHKYYFRYVVLACNTATASAIEKLRKEYLTINFIGTEPAVNLAYKLNYKFALSIATPTTIKQKRYKKLVRKTPIKIKSYAPTNLAHLIDNYILNKKINSKLKIIKYIYLISKKSVKNDCIILGCTHYSFIKTRLNQNVHKKIIDGNKGVANNLYNQINKNSHLKDFCNRKFTVKFLFSRNAFKQKEKYIKILNQILAKKHFI